MFLSCDNLQIFTELQSKIRVSLLFINILATILAMLKNTFRKQKRKFAKSCWFGVVFRHINIFQINIDREGKNNKCHLKHFPQLIYYDQDFRFLRIKNKGSSL